MSIEVEEEARSLLWWAPHHIDVSIYVGDVAAGIVAEAVSGEIEVELAEGSVKLETTSGDIRVYGAMLDQVEAKAVSGDISVELAEGYDLGCKVRLKTMSGRLLVDVPNMKLTVDGEREKAGETRGFSEKPIRVKVEAETTSGSISVEALGG